MDNISFNFIPSVVAGQKSNNGKKGILITDILLTNI